MLICNICGRIEDKPFEVGDGCFELCGGKMKKVLYEYYITNDSKNGFDLFLCRCIKGKTNTIAKFTNHTVAELFSKEFKIM